MSEKVDSLLSAMKAQGLERADKRIGRRNGFAMGSTAVFLRLSIQPNGIYPIGISTEHIVFEVVAHHEYVACIDLQISKYELEKSRRGFS